MRLLILYLLLLAVNARRHSSSSSSSSDEGDISEGRLVLSKNTFDKDSYLKTRPSSLSESLSGKELIDYVNGRQDLWIVGSSYSSTHPYKCYRQPKKTSSLSTQRRKRRSLWVSTMSKTVFMPDATPPTAVI